MQQYSTLVTNEMFHSPPSVALQGLLLSCIYLQKKKKKAPLTSQNLHESYKGDHPQRNKQHGAVFTLLDEKQKQAS